MYCTGVRLASPRREASQTAQRTVLVVRSAALAQQCCWLLSLAAKGTGRERRDGGAERSAAAGRATDAAAGADCADGLQRVRRDRHR